MAPPSSTARPKRGGEESHASESKKPRFDYRNPSTLAADAPDDDIILDADVIGKSGVQTKRNAVNIDGYESDSDNDNFDARAAERERTNKQGETTRDVDEDDMFAEEGNAHGDEDKDEELGWTGKKKGNKVRFLHQAEIEGQVMNSKSGGHVSSEILLGGATGQRPRRDSVSSASSGSDEERDAPPEEMEEDLAAEIGAGGKKKHAPRLDAFNLQAEEEEGRYDESGNFVRKAVDPDAVNDGWLDGLSKKDMRRAKEAAEKRDEERRLKAARDDATLTSDVLAILIQHLDTGETPLEALQRLNKGKQKEAKIPKWKLKKQKDKMEIDGSGEVPDPAETARKIAVEAITGAADALYSREQHEIYETERELLMRQYTRETGEDWRPATNDAILEDRDSGADAMWEYRWIDARDGGDTHGPYDVTTMKAWNEAGYFGEGVEFRTIGATTWRAGFE